MSEIWQTLVADWRELNTIMQFTVIWLLFITLKLVIQDYDKK